MNIKIIKTQTGFEIVPDQAAVATVDQFLKALRGLVEQQKRQADAEWYHIRENQRDS